MPTPNYSTSRLERAFMQTQPVFGTIPNSGGSASVSGSDAVRFIRLTMENDVALLERPDKTGTRSIQGSIGGRRFGRWTFEASLVGSGTPGTPPDVDPLYQAITGQTATIGSGTVNITSSTDATPIVVTTSGTHGLSDYSCIFISGHTTNTNANGAWAVLAPTTSTLVLLGSRGTGGGVGASGTVDKASVNYNLSDAINMLTLWSYRTEFSTLDQRAGNSCVVQEATFNLGQDVATWTISGECRWVLRSNAFGTSDDLQKGGLTSFPAEPSSPVTSGDIIPGFTGRFAIGSSANMATDVLDYPTVRTATIRVQTQNQIAKDTFGSYYGSLTEGAERNITITWNIYDDDSDEVNAIKLASEEKTPQNIIVNVGTEAGSAFFFILKNVYLGSHVLGDGQLRFDAAFSDSRASASSLALRDELQISIV